jgi:receptor protein-tyrosine kinase
MYPAKDSGSERLPAGTDPPEVATLTRRAEMVRVKRSLGALLVDAGLIDPADVQRILEYQGQYTMRFGEAVVALRLVTALDVERLLAQQYDHSYLLRGHGDVSEDVVAAYDPGSPEAEAIRAIRAQLLARWFHADVATRSLAIISAESKEGRSYIAANLAVAFCQLGKRTLLIDADLRAPCQHRLFGVDDHFGLSSMLAGRAGAEAIKRVPGLNYLGIIPRGPPPPNPSELLARPTLGELLKELAREFEVILLDTSPTGHSADALSVSTHARGALVVVRKNATRSWRLQGVADRARTANCSLVGSVLNDC